MTKGTCSIGACTNNLKARGWCNKHYRRFMKYGDPLYLPPKGRQPSKILCSIDGCERKHNAKGWCLLHYTRWKRHGDPMTVKQLQSKRGNSIGESFEMKTVQQEECTLWTGAKSPQGYGLFWNTEKVVSAHRFSWERENGPIPDGMHIDHKCWNPQCVNPNHLRLSTPSENGTYLRGANSNNTSSGFRNVHKHKDGWIVRLVKDKKRYSYGCYSDVDEAVKVAELARKELFGEFAGLG